MSEQTDDELTKAYFARHRVYPSKSVSALRWSEPGTGINRIDYLIVDRTLIVRGDLGDAVFDWSSPRSFHQLAGTSIDYFLEKSRASEFGRFVREWDSEVAFREAINQFSWWADDIELPKELTGDPLTFEQHKKRAALWLKENSEPLESDSAESIIYDIECHCDHESEWCRWLHEDCEIYDLKSIGDCGFVVPLRARLWHIGLKLAVAQLPDDYVHPSVQIWPSQPSPIQETASSP